MARRVAIRWEGGGVTGRWRRPRQARGPAVLLAHGAGAGQDHPALVGIRDGLAGLGHPVLTFNYPYMEERAQRGTRRPPDRPARLLECHRAAASWLRRRFETVALAGRSMGGRMSTILAAEGEPCAGVVAFSYPLHPAGRPEKLRVEHLPQVAVPMLFITGSRDRLAHPLLIDRHLRPLPQATVEIIPDADHSLAVPRRAGRTSQQVREEAAAFASRWIKELPGQRRGQVGLEP